MRLVPSSAIRPSLPLAALLDHREFGAEMLSPDPRDSALVAEARARRFALVIAIDLLDPTPYLSPGDLLLVTGLGLPRDPEEILQYIGRVKRSGISGIVFGREPVYAEVPDELIEACRDQAVTLIQLPPPVYFASIVKFVNSELETERTRALSAMVATALRLAEAAVRTAPDRRLVTVLAHDCDGWAVLRSGDEVSAAGPIPAEIDLGDLLAALEQRLGPQLNLGGLPTAFTSVEAQGRDYEVAAHLVRGPHRQSRSTETAPILVLGKPSRITSSDRTALLLAAHLAGVTEQVPADQSAAVDRLLMHFLVDAAPSTASSRDRARIAGLLTSVLGTGTTAVHAIVAERLGAHPAAASTADEAWLRRLLRSPLVEHRGRRLRAFTAHAPSRADLDRAAELGWALAISRATTLAELPRAMHEAEELGRTARRLGRHIAGHDPEELGRLWPLSAVTDPTLGNAAANLWLAPLSGEEHAEERAALAAWLRRHGSWDRTARDLGLHRNTVRRLVAAAGERLGRDLDDPVERARTLLAFATLEPED